MKPVVTLLLDEGLNKLSQKSEKVAFTILGDGSLCLDKQTLDLIQDLKEFTTSHNGLGMSAIQLGVPKNIFVMRKPWKSDNIVAIINPSILSNSLQTSLGIEGCFSIPLPPNTGAVVSRSNKIDVQYETDDGKLVKETLTDIEARIFQHELDHLEGILMIDESRFKGWRKNS